MRTYADGRPVSLVSVNSTVLLFCNRDGYRFRGPIGYLRAALKGSVSGRICGVVPPKLDREEAARTIF
jgi:hypothetical protein